MKKSGFNLKRKKVKEQEQPSMEGQEEIQDTATQTTEPQQPDLSAAFDQLTKDHEELRDKYLRIYADFDNFKKRALKEKLDLMRTAAQETLTALLPVVDDFDRAKQNAEKEGSAETMSEGVLLVYHKLWNTLKGLGLEEMETREQVFDPEFHEAITEIPAPTEELKGKIVDTVEKGYKLGEKIIRYAKVVVGK